MKWRRIDIGSPLVSDWELKCPICGDILATVIWVEVIKLWKGQIFVVKAKPSEKIITGKRALDVRRLVNARLEELLNT